jgi:hypothetical protein
MTQSTAAHACLTIGKQSLVVIGSGTAYIGVMYFGKLVFTSAVDVLEWLPYALTGRIQPIYDDQPRSVWFEIGQRFLQATKCASVIGIGVGLKLTGNFIVEDILQRSAKLLN